MSYHQRGLSRGSYTFSKSCRGARSLSDVWNKLLSMHLDGRKF